MALDTTYRTNEPEIMDDFLLEGEEFQDALDKIANINRLLGGNAVTLNGVKKLLRQMDTDREINIIDIGCGNGDMLRMLSDYGNRNGLKFRLVGIDANSFTINYAAALSGKHGNIRYECRNIFEEGFSFDADIALCTLTLHHFKDDEIDKLLRLMYANVQTGIVINDLHRSKTAYRLFSILCSILGLNRITREDGLISILRGFKKEELEGFSKKAGFKKYSINWRWAFRYEWIIYKL